MPATAIEKSERPSRVPWLVVLVILLVFAGAIFLVTRHLRSSLRTKIIQQEGLALAAGLMVSRSLTEDLPAELENDPELILEAVSGDVVGAAITEEEVIAVRVF